MFIDAIEFSWLKVESSNAPGGAKEMSHEDLEMGTMLQGVDLLCQGRNWVILRGGGGTGIFMMNDEG